MPYSRLPIRSGYGGEGRCTCNPSAFYDWASHCSAPASLRGPSFDIDRRNCWCSPQMHKSKPSNPPRRQDEQGWDKGGARLRERIMKWSRQLPPWNICWNTFTAWHNFYTQPGMFHNNINSLVAFMEICIKRCSPFPPLKPPPQDDHNHPLPRSIGLRGAQVVQNKSSLRRFFPELMWQN